MPGLRDALLFGLRSRPLRGSAGATFYTVSAPDLGLVCSSGTLGERSAGQSSPASAGHTIRLMNRPEAMRVFT